jgi:glycosyltransferase involved in cell wall biosynthesis
MKICHVTDALPGRHKSWGGAEQGCLRVMEALAAAGTEVSAAAARASAGGDGPAFSEIAVWETYFNKPLVWRYSLVKDRFLPFDPLAFFSCLSLFRRLRPDVVHLHRVNRVSYAPVLAARLLGIPTVLSVYDYWLLCPGMVLYKASAPAACPGYHGPWCRNCPGSGAGRLSSLLRGPLFGFFLRRIDAFHALSASSRDILVRYGVPAGRVLVAPVPPPPSAAPDVPVKPGRILFSGWIEPRKGAEIVLRAMPEVFKAFPEAELVLIGGESDPAYAGRVRALAAAPGLAGRVHFKGKVPAAEAAAYLRSAEVVVVAEQWENMSPIVLIEAMAQGKPAVAGDIGGISEFIQDGLTGLLVKYDSPQAYAAALCAVLAGREKAAAMGNAAAARARELCDPGKIAAGLKGLYSRLAAGGKG